MPKISSKKLSKLHEEKIRITLRLEDISKEEQAERNKIIGEWKK